MIVKVDLIMTVMAPVWLVGMAIGGALATLLIVVLAVFDAGYFHALAGYTKQK